MKFINNKYSNYYVAFFVATVLFLGLASFRPSNINEITYSSQSNNNYSITEQEVAEAQRAWGDGIVNIGKVYKENGDYVKAAIDHINKFYNYQEGTVLFKPTLAAEKQFRTDFDGALSYFVAGNKKYPEDHGFAIKPWSKVRWENIGTKILGNVALAMGNYYFTPANGSEEVKVEYSFAYIKNSEGKLKIILHDSHLPYKPVKEH